jgi:hypothetical protein
MTAARDAPGHHAPSAEDQLTITAQPTPNKQESLDIPAPFPSGALSNCAEAGAADGQTLGR